jgi:hypothetical protein
LEKIPITLEHNRHNIGLTQEMKIYQPPGGIEKGKNNNQVTNGRI